MAVKSNINIDITIDEALNNREKFKSILTRVETAGKINSTRNIEIKNEIKVIKKDSLQNCFINCSLFAPATFLIPTSLFLRADLAVVKLIKLITAIISIKTAIIPKT